MKSWIEYRAVYGRPASYLDPEHKTTGEVEERTKACKSISEARAVALHRAEETHAWVKYYEERTVTATEWRPGQ